MIEPINFYELMRASHIKRWHIVNTVNQQNLAEHHYNATVIGLELYSLLAPNDPSAEFMAALLFHDVAEIRYGDIPTPGKMFIRQITENWGHGDLFNHMDQKLVPTTPYVEEGGELSGVEFNIIKLADLIEAAWWIKENGAGSHAQIVADKCWQSVQEFVAITGWYDQADKILGALGMPRISRNVMVTPP
jgi:5'-deoxynucleotidase YfbR-like HD superfamily hydrolase